MTRYKGWMAGLLALALVFCLFGCQRPEGDSLPLVAELTEITPVPDPSPVPESPPVESQSPSPTADPKGNTESLDEWGSYDSVEDVALYIRTYGDLPDNYMTKDEAEDLGWSGGSLERYAAGKCIGGDRFSNREGLLPKANGRVWTECDIDTLGRSNRGAKRIVYSNDGLIYYTDDHYQSFEKLYPED